jgi:hypothetical protein
MATTAKDKKVFLSDLHYEHRLWRNELNFYKDELAILQERLDEIVSKNTDHEAVAGVESFQNRFELQRKNLSDLKHKIKKHEQMLADFAESHPIAIDHVHFIDHTGIRNEMETFTDLYQEMKREFNRFAVKWM